MYEDCLFCSSNRFSLNKKLNLPAQDSVIYEDSNVYVTPDLFPLCVGHMLIITKQHYYSMGCTSQSIRDSMNNAIDYILKNVFVPSSQWIIFEHGANHINKGGSSINHTHLHVLPLYLNLEMLIASSGYDIFRMEYTDELLHNCALKDIPYLYIKDCKGSELLYPVHIKIPSQFLRMLIGNNLNVAFDWKDSDYGQQFRSKFMDSLKLATK